ncbi:MAG: hypothetical protein EZS28_044542 [Streblomastix strix]|uniref:Uncharacterized protein n=1 Tax=Streblomastix strix TaxID=222440 RepID=A0A5J4TR35_9EUKA|nr:MAG: hypothetical protein EZS28_044542 [Streblomastix strix]
MPKAKRDMKDMILPFVCSVIQCIQRTVTISTIKHGFMESGQVPYDRNRIFAKIPAEPPYRAVVRHEQKKANIRAKKRTSKNQAKEIRKDSNNNK